MNESPAPKRPRWGLWAGVGVLAVIGIFALASSSSNSATAVPAQGAAVQSAVQQGQQTPTAPAALSNDNYYTNVSGNMVHSPAYSANGSVPAGATAQCRDGTYSFSQHREGTCSYHGGVKDWLQ
jgi:hypothetical protein